MRDCVERYKILRAQFSEAKAKAEALENGYSGENGGDSNDLTSTIVVNDYSKGAAAVKAAEEVEAAVVANAKQEAAEHTAIDTSIAQAPRTDSARVISATTTFKMPLPKPPAPAAVAVPTPEPKSEIGSEQQNR